MIIKFFSNEYDNPKKAWYSQIICLAYGLKIKNIDFFGENNYWMNLDKNEYLIKKDNRDYDVAIYSYTYVQNNQIKLDTSKYNILYDHADGVGCWYESKELPFNLILRTHYSNKLTEHYTNNVVPWAFYIPLFIRSEIDKYRGEKIQENVWINHRIEEGHSLRTQLKNVFKNNLPSEKIYEKIAEDVSEEYPSYWAQTGRRFNKSYLKELSKHRFTFAFGGIAQKDKLIQYDSWRFWEAMYSQSIPLHMNLSNWNCVLPYMPVSDKHYISISNIDDVKHLFETYDENDLTEISNQGKAFIDKNYTEENLVNYLLEMMK